MMARTHVKQLEKPSRPDEKSLEQGRSYNRQTGKWTEGGRVAEGPVVVRKRSNVRGAKRPYFWQTSYQHGEAEVR